jgi:hypothetical protein
VTRSRPDPVPITALRLRLDALLSAEGFSLTSEKPLWTGKFKILTWTRRTWRHEEARLGWRIYPWGSYLLDFGWSVPRRNGSLLHILFLNPGYARRQSTERGLPTAVPLIGGLLAERWMREIVSDAAYGVKWLAESAWREDAIQAMEASGRFASPGAKRAYATARGYVRKHAPRRP